MLNTSILLRFMEDPAAMRHEFGLMRNAGFDTFDFDLSNKSTRSLFLRQDLHDYVQRAKDLLDEAGVSPYQGHAPFHPYHSGNPERSAANMDDIRRSIPIAGQLGIRYLVVHPIFAEPWDDLFNQRDEIIRRNVELYRELCAIGADCHVNICTENLFSKAPNGLCSPCFSSTAQDLLDIIQEVPALSVCLDYGHALLVNQNPSEMACAFGKHLTTLHLHCNNGLMDTHVSPFESMTTDWQGFGKALHDIGYSGSINLETHRVYYHAPDEILPATFTYLHACAALIAKYAD